ncbi:MAG: THUMP domain-containing protein [Candidatus Heimdallarchaeaceae archaeon]|jgi:tRNA(Ser,Leu) C12 N-acetylase TAN1
MDYSGLLISSARTLERNASSEIYYLLAEVFEYKDVKVEPVKQISGLSIAKFSEDPIETFSKIRNASEEDKSIFQFTLKIVPLQYRVLSSLENLKKIAQKIKEEIKETNTWGIRVRRRHSQIARKEIISTIADEIDKGKVDLENPDCYIFVEILGKWSYLSVSPYPEFSISKNITAELDNDFTF